MSIEVATDEVGAAIAGRTGQAYLVTLRGGEGDLRPHVVAVRPEVRADGALRVAVGRRTAANVVERPSVTLLWPTDPGDPTHTLLVDGEARPGPDGEVVVTPTAAVLHRLRAAADSTRDT